MNAIVKPPLRFTPADLKALLEAWAEHHWVYLLPNVVITFLTVGSGAAAIAYEPALWGFAAFGLLVSVVFALQAVGLLDANPEPFGSEGWRELDFARWRLRLIAAALLLVSFPGLWLWAATGDIGYTILWAIPGLLVLEICLSYVVMRYDTNPDLD